MNADNSDVMTHVMNSFFNVISTRTSPAHAWLTIKVLLQKVEHEHGFINNVDVIDISPLKLNEYYKTNFDIIKFDPDIINNVDQQRIGEVIQFFIVKLKEYMGKKASYHLLREFRDDLGTDYYSIIRNMGVDLHLIELRDELYGPSSVYYTSDDEEY